MPKKITLKELKKRVFNNWLSLFSLPLTFLLIQQIQEKAPVSQILPTIGGILAVLFGVDSKKETPAEVKKAAVKKAKSELKQEVNQTLNKAAEENIKDAQS